MRPRSLALAGLAVAALSASAFLLLDLPPNSRVNERTTFDGESYTFSEERPDPPPHAFAVNVPSDAANAGVRYVFRVSGPDRPGGQAAPIHVILALYVDGEEGTYKDKTPLGETYVARSVIDHGQSGPESFSIRGQIYADLTPGFHVIQFRVDTTDRMTEHWEWTVEPLRFELEYDVSNGWRGGPAPLVGLAVGLAASLFLWGWAIKGTMEPPEAGRR